MKRHETVLAPTSGEVVDFLSATIEQLSPILKRMRRDEIQYWISHKGKLGHAFRKAFASDAGTEVLVEWEKFYLKFFGMNLDLSSVNVPLLQPTFDRVIVIARGLTLNQALKACKNRFPTYSYWGDDLDGAVVQNDRISASGHYAIRVRDRVEADEELKNLSATDLEERKIAGVTLLERLVLELKYFDETGKHLDIQNITLCASSRDSVGDVPAVYWLGGRLYVDWCFPRTAYSGLRARARAVVSA